jgi:hypothetical protein
MADKKAPGPVEQSIIRLRELRYMTRGPGAVRARPVKLPSIDKLRADIAMVPAKKSKKKSKKGKRR